MVRRHYRVIGFIVLSCLIIVAFILIYRLEDRDSPQQYLYGEWAVVRLSLPDRDFGSEATSQIVVRFENDTMIVSTEIGRFTYPFLLEPAAEPKHIDFAFDEAPRAFQLKGIYVLEGDTLTIGLNPKPGDKRPLVFDSSAGTSLIVLKRRQ